MRVLFVSTRFPRDLSTYVSGSFQRMNMFIDAIKGISQLDILFFVPPDMNCSSSAVSSLEKSLADHWAADIRLSLCPWVQPNNHASKMAYGAAALSFFKQPNYLATGGPQQVDALENRLQGKPDLIFAHRLISMVPLLRTQRTLPRICLDLDDIEHIAFFRSIKQKSGWRDKLIDYSHLPALWLGEQRAIKLAWRTFVCSEQDRKYLAERWRLPGIVTVPNAVEIPPMQQMTRDPTVLFLGTYAYQPNIEAAEFLVQRIWPRIHQAIPKAHLIIAGKYPEAIPSHNTSVPGVEFAGFVHDLRNLYAQSRVVVAPILSGGGTRIKIIEAAAYGKPIVATRLGVEGLQFDNGSELLIRDDPASFADACVQLLQDPVSCERLGRAAHAVVVRCYNRANTVSLIQRHLKDEHVYS